MLSAESRKKRAVGSLHCSRFLEETRKDASKKAHARKSQHGCTTIGAWDTTRRAAFTPSFLKSSKILNNEGAAYRRDAPQRYIQIF